jgi:glycosyltransferase involved in cell wall biosynthesis
MGRIDVLVTCYNYGRFLRQCVESVLAQSYDHVRVVIVDDASSDDTEAVSAQLFAEDPRVEIARHAVNAGHIATYNDCIDRADGEFMLILSADDFLLPGALERAAEVLRLNPELGLTVGDGLQLHDGDRMLGLPRGAPIAVKVEPVELVGLLAEKNFVSTATAVARTAVQKALGYYRADLPHAGDLEMWLRYALYSRVAYIKAHQAAYRHHDANMSLAYDAAADLRQCAQAFDLHYGAIRERLPDGAAIEARIRQSFAARALALASAGDVAG